MTNDGHTQASPNDRPFRVVSRGNHTEPATPLDRATQSASTHHLVAVQAERPSSTCRPTAREPGRSACGDAKRDEPGDVPTDAWDAPVAPGTPIYVGTSETGDLNDALQDAIAFAKDDLGAGAVIWELRTIRGFSDDSLQCNDINVAICAMPADAS